MMIQLMIILLLLLIRFKSSFNVLKPPSPSKVQSLLRSPDAKTNSKIVIIVGFEAFNFELYKKTVSIVRGKVPSVDIEIFTDMDITESPERVEKALDGADVLFASLLFDYAQVNWILPKIENIPVRFVFESAQELMSETSVGEFKMRPSETGQMAGPPPFVKSLLKQFGSAKEEDKMAGYLKLLKIGPKVLNLVPRRGSLGEKLKDVRAWLTVYSYWNQGSVPNVVSMLYYIIDTFGLAASTAEIPVAQSLIEAPDSAFYHPKLFETDGYVESARQYVLWYERNHAWVTADTPRVGLLLYRKHVLSDQSYICNLITLMETEGIMPIPIFITGVEAHVIVRDIFVTKNEVPNPRQLTGDRVFVDAIVNTIGFPLVGGPAGSMEGGRQIEVSKAILSSKNVPYIVAAPLLIQDMGSWQQTGVQGLQTVILYSLPELDAAIDTIVLGGLVNKENIIVLPERVRKLTQRLKAWVRLAKLPNKDKKISMLLYGFPPNVGAVGTAALLNVARSLRNVLLRLHSEGYNIGSRELVTLLQNDEESGELLIKALTSIAKNARSKQTILADLLALGLKDITLVHREVSWRELQGWIGKQMTQKIASNWGELEVYTDVGSAGSGILLVQGLQVGNIFLGLQPLLGVEGDPMRMLFERDLTPHPQYATYYAWLQKELRTDALVHFGMHGTVEWLPGTPLGNTPESWPDLLLGDLPNLYIYACNNPSESILAKRRGYATIISHNVPSYSRSGLYNELREIRGLVSEFLESLRTESNSESSRSDASFILPQIIAMVSKAGLFDDLPYRGTLFSDPSGSITPEYAEGLLASDTATKDNFVAGFSDYAVKLSSYLSELEQRLFSEGLHVFGGPSSAGQLRGYLDAVCDQSKVSEHVLYSVSENSVVGKSSAQILMASVGEHKESMTENSFGWNILTGSNNGQGVLKAVGDFFRYQNLRQLRIVGDKNAEIEFNDLVLDKLSEGAGFTGDKAELLRAVSLSQSLAHNHVDEMQGLLSGLSGQYVAAAPGGDLIRDGSSVLPTGRNIYALDPYRIPSATAFLRGSLAANLIIKTHQSSNNGAYPETVAVTLWGLDTIKTCGESIGIVLGLVGAEPVREATGRIVSFALIPLDKLNRPRIDVLASLSGIFRDSFENVLDLLDKLFEAAATADEPDELNFIKKHTSVFKASGEERPYSRLFSNAPGDFGSMVGERVGSGEWESGSELGDTWQKRNSFSYGRTGERGASREGVLKQLLNTTDRIVQEVDSVEYGLTDIQEYYANTGALKKAAENNRDVKSVGSSNSRAARVSVSVIEATEKEVRPRELEEVLRAEYRAKLLNPKWSTAMLKQGSSGAYEISGRLTAMVGWAATTDFSEKWVWDATSDKYAMDDEMAQKLRDMNPEAFRNIVKRLLEASGRGFWQASGETLARLQELYQDVEDEIEGV